MACYLRWPPGRRTAVKGAPMARLPAGGAEMTHCGGRGRVAVTAWEVCCWSHWRGSPSSFPPRALRQRYCRSRLAGRTAAGLSSLETRCGGGTRRVTAVQPPTVPVQKMAGGRVRTANDDDLLAAALDELSALAGADTGQYSPGSAAGSANGGCGYWSPGRPNVARAPWSMPCSGERCCRSA